MTVRPTRRPGEVAFVIVLLVFSGLALWQSYGISGFTGLAAPGVFPMLASAAMVLSGLAVLGDTVRRSAERPHGRHRSSAFLAMAMPGRLMFGGALICGYVVAMSLAGFLASSALFLFLMLVVLWRKGALAALAVTALSLMAIHVIFRLVFQVVLPEGSLVQGLI